ncbi:MAG: hypothetical protein QXM71_07210 [Thermofilum sp.]
MRPTPPKQRLVRCPRCGYEWWTRSKLKYIVCPNCRRAVQPEVIVE